MYTGVGHGRRAPETGVRDGCELPCGCRDPNPGPLGEQPVLLATEPWLQPRHSCFRPGPACPGLEKAGIGTAAPEVWAGGKDEGVQGPRTRAPRGRARRTDRSRVRPEPVCGTPGAGPAADVPDPRGRAAGVPAHAGGPLPRRRGVPQQRACRGRGAVRARAAGRPRPAGTPASRAQWAGARAVGTPGPDAQGPPRPCSQIWKSWPLSLHALSTTWTTRGSPISSSSTPVSEGTGDRGR